ncbi:MAG: lysylphosphatidylglycerol synthase transmembrane domain-containing protein [Weeksellaceae bacterium]|jgi:uncharacterized protein (TIRG00374 family)|nr:lysylphosphatidylglycerol synthase transmembrane domain-containing protein [Weeksellaceae bacterium]MDX9705136.1 lysylphosphatidylglycerol synthase transmembrane domain-containing protein [Weeksellaceae bacterium]
MKSKISQFVFLVISLILAVIFIGLTLKQTDFEALKTAFQQANYFWILLSMALSIFSYWLRAARWKFLLEPLGYKTVTKSGFWAISFAYFMNLTIPRSGEVARATSFYKMENVPVDKSLGTIVLERVIDLCFLLLFMGITFILSAETLYSFFAHSNTASFDKLKLIIGIGILIFLLIFLFRKKLKRLPFYEKIVQFIKGIIVGFRSILHLKKRGLFVLYSFGIWICYFLMTYVVFFAFPETSKFGLEEGFFLIISGALGMILPAVGGLGYPYVMSVAFVALYTAKGLPSDEGRAVGNYFGLILYFAQVISILLFGLLSVYFIPKLSRSKNKPIKIR